MIDARAYERSSRMPGRKGFDYYGAFKSQAQYCEEIARNLRSGIEAGELGSRALTDALHTVENDADQVNHQIQSHLLSDFVVPLERDGMGALAHALDDVVDAVEQVAIQAYIFDVSELPHDAVVMVSMLVYACADLKAALDELPGFARHSADIGKHLVKVQSYESDCDRIYIDAAHALYADKSADPQVVRLSHALLDTVEEAMDCMENAAERIQALIAQSA